jgi:hypothetical protein
MRLMSGFDVRAFMSAAASARGAGPAPAGLLRRSVPIAEAVAAVVIRPSYSPAIVCGVTRFIELALVVLAGIFVHQIYLDETILPGSSYWLATAGTATLTILVFQGIGVYSVAAFRSFFIYP